MSCTVVRQYPLFSLPQSVSPRGIRKHCSRYGTSDTNFPTCQREARCIFQRNSETEWRTLTTPSWRILVSIMDQLVLTRITRYTSMHRDSVTRYNGVMPLTPRTVRWMRCIVWCPVVLTRAVPITLSVAPEWVCTSFPRWLHCVYRYRLLDVDATTRALNLIKPGY